MRPFHPTYIFEVLPQLFPYIGVTIAVTFGTVLGGGLIGLLLAAAKIKRGRIAKVLVNTYVYLTRCIPSIVMLFIVYYGLPELLMVFGIDINNIHKAFFVITTFSILFAANMSEVFRSAYEAVNKGQREAAVSIGMTEFQAFRRILLPQCTIYAIPNFANALVNLIKEGSLAYTIGLIDIMGKGQLIIGLNMGSYSLETYLALFILYWILILLIEKSLKFLEKRLLQGRKILNTAG
ncbi:MAG: ABC transporter permease subunit [Lachnospiraceae bacterium]|nr:ABC transporter permease subunit [Lachnospiraceae bacterium]